MKITPIDDKDLENFGDLESIEKHAKKFYKGWKKFAFKEDIINVAIGMIIATSFKYLVNSLVTDIIMPILIGLGAGTSAENLFIVLVPGKTINATYNTLEEAKESGAVTLNYGSFITVFLDLIFISLLLYITLGFINKIQKEVKRELFSSVRS